MLSKGAVLAALWFLFAGQSAAFAGATPQLVNRSLIQVGSTIYTSWEALFLLCGSNAFFDKQVLIKGDWLLKKSPPHIPPESSAQVFRENPDLERFLFLALAIEESQKLNLFVQTSEEIEKGVTRLQSSVGACPWGVVSEKAQQHFEALPQEKFKSWSEKILRAKAFEQVRGGLSRNTNLLRQNWTWLTSVILPAAGQR